MALPVSQGGIDYPDGGFPSGSGLYPVVGDLAELAARLGSVDTYDRRGSVLWWDDFNRGVAAWNLIEQGTGAAVEVSALWPMWGPYCVQLTGGSTVARRAGIEYYQGLPTLYRLGLEVSVNLATDWGAFYIDLGYYDGSLYRYGSIRLNDEDDTIDYYDSSGAWQDFATLPALKNIWGGYHQCKLVMDFEEETYVRFLLGKDSHDLSAYTLRQSASAQAPVTRLFVWLQSRSGENDICYVDGVILTQNEP